MEFVTVLVQDLVGENPEGETRLEVPAYWPTIWGEIARSKPYKKSIRRAA